MADDVPQPPRKRERSAPYPRDDLKSSEEFARIAFDLGARDVLQDAVASATGYSGTANGAYKRSRASAKYFGLVEYTGDEFISVTEPWIAAFHDEDAAALRAERIRAVRQPELYRQLFETYADRMLPRPDKLARELYLNPQYGILQDAATDAAQTFWVSANFAGLIDEKGFLRLDPPQEEGRVASKAATEHIGTEELMPEREQDGPRLAARVPLEGYDTFEIRVSGNRKVVIQVPSPGTLSESDKARVKGHVDLIPAPEDIENSPSQP